jgi:hypothetical protein
MTFMMFRRYQQTTPTEPVEYPIGSFVKSELGYFYIFSNSKRMRFISKRVLDSWSPHRVILTSEVALEKYRVSSKMKFRNGSLIHNISDGKIYLIEEGKRRHVTSPDALERIGAGRSEVVSVSLDEVKIHELGEELK